MPLHREEFVLYLSLHLLGVPGSTVPGLPNYPLGGVGILLSSWRLFQGR